MGLLVILRTYRTPQCTPPLWTLPHNISSSHNSLTSLHSNLFPRTQTESFLRSRTCSCQKLLHTETTDSHSLSFPASVSASMPDSKHPRSRGTRNHKLNEEMKRSLQLHAETLSAHLPLTRDPNPPRAAAASPSSPSSPSSLTVTEEERSELSTGVFSVGAGGESVLRAPASPAQHKHRASHGSKRPGESGGGGTRRKGRVETMSSLTINHFHIT